MDFRKLAESCKDDYLKDLNALVSVNSVRDDGQAGPGKPFGPGPREALDTFLSMAEKDGFETRNVDGYAGTVSYGEGKETVGILGHLDVVPLGEGWTKEPLKVTVKDGYVFGRGVLDDKGPTLAAYYALKLIRDQKIPLSRKILLIAGTDEESGMGCMDYYENHGEIPDLGFTPDADFPVIYGEKGNIHMSLASEADSLIQSLEAGTRPNIVIQKSDAVVKSDDIKEDLFNFYLRTNGLTGSVSQEEDGIHLHMEGIPAHGAMPYNGINAGVHMLNYIGEAYGDQLAKDFHALLKDWKGTPVGINKEGVYMGFLTMNPGLINIRDGKASALVDIRYPNDTTPEAVQAGFDAAVKNLATDIRADMVYQGDPLFVDPESELVKGLMASYQKYTGDTFTPPITIGGGTYAKKFKNFVAFGPEKLGEAKTTKEFVGGCHQRDEGVKLDDLIEAIAIYADALVNLAGAKE